MTIRGGLRTLGLTALDLVFPRRCPACDCALYEWDTVLCPSCSERMTRLVGRPYCDRCGYGVGPYHLPGEACPECRLHRFHYSGLVRVGPHVDVLRRMQLAYKYRKRSDLPLYFGQLLGNAILGRLDPSSVDAIVPIPTTWWRAIRFGPPTVTAMARQVSKHTKIPLADVLRVKEKRRRQQGLSATQRWQNVKGKFGLKAGSGLKGTTLCLVDDVATTGATLSEAAKVLRRHGAGQVYAAVITKTDLSRPEGIPSPTSHGSSP